MLCSGGSVTRPLARILALALVISAMLAATAASSFAAIGISSFTLTPSTTIKSANPDLSISAKRTGSDSDDVLQTNLKLAPGVSYSLSGVTTRCSATQLSQNTCPAASMVGDASSRFSLLGSTITAPGTVYALSTGQLGTIYRPANLPRYIVKSGITGAWSTGISIRTGDYPRTTSLLGLIPVPLTFNHLTWLLKGRSTSSAVIVTNPSTCGAAPSILSLIPYSGATATGSSSFAVTGCGAPPETALQDPLPAAPTLTPSITATSNVAGATFECRINSGTFKPCTPNSGAYGDPLTNAAVNKIDVRAVFAGVSDGSPSTTYIWTDNRSTPDSVLTATPSTTQAGAAPNLASTVRIDGGWNPKQIAIDLPPGLNISAAGTNERCALASASAGTCGSTAPGSLIGSAGAVGVSSRDGSVVATGSAYLTVSPGSSASTGVAIVLQLPGGLGTIASVADLKYVQANNGVSPQGEVRQRLEATAVPQRTSSGNRFHFNSLSLNITGDPVGGSFALLTNPGSCPGTPVQFRVTAATFGTDGTDASSGPAAPQSVLGYPVTGCGSLALSPTASQDYFMPDPIDGSTYDTANPIVQNVGSALKTNDPAGTRLGLVGADTTIGIPAGQSRVKNLTNYQPSSVGVSIVGYGTAAQKCAGSSAQPTSIFTANCPADGSAKVGKITIDSPLFPQPLVGNVLAIGKSPIPWLGIDINPSVSPTNPAGVTLRLTAMTNLTPIPGCVSSGSGFQPWCGDRYQLRIAGMPDIPITSVDLDLSGRSARPVPTLDPLLFTTVDVNDPSCRPEDVNRWTFDPQSGGASSNVDQNVTLDPCVEEPPDTTGPSIQLISPVNGSTTQDTTTTLTYNAADPSGPPSCSPASGAVIPLSLGANTITVNCTDTLGNPSSASTTVTRVAPPNEPPVITISTPVDLSSTTAESTPLEYLVTDDSALAPTCTPPSGSIIPLTLGLNTIVVTCTDSGGIIVSKSVQVTRVDESGTTPNTTINDPLPAAPTLTPSFSVTSSLPSSTYECRVNNVPAGWAACNPGAGIYGSGIAFNNAAVNKLEVRSVTAGTPDPSPATTYIWTDNAAAPSATATVTPSTTQAGAHPDISTTSVLNGGWNPKSLTVDVPPGLNGALTGTAERCAIASANVGTCAATAPGSLIGTASGTGVSTRDGLVNALGTLYMTESPNASSPAGVALEMPLPNGLGTVRAIGDVRITQVNNGTSQGRIRQQIFVQSIPQRTDSGNRFHANSVTMNLQGDPPGGSYPLLTNPTSCPATPAQFQGVGATYGADGLDASNGPAVPQVNVNYPVTGCSSLPFNPQINEEFFAWDPVDGSAADYTAPVVQSVGSTLFSNDSATNTRLGEFGVKADMTLPAGSKMIKDITSFLPAGIGANLPAFGSAAAKCTGSGVTTTVIWPGTCPASGIAEIGYMTINTPLLDHPLVGRVKAIGKTPIPWLGIDIQKNATWGVNNPTGVSLRLLGFTNLEDPAGCSATAAPHCTGAGHVVVRFTGLPDVPLSSATLDMSGADARPLGTLSPLLLISPDQGDPDCITNDAAITTFTPQGSTPGSPDDVTRQQNTTLTQC